MKRYLSHSTEETEQIAAEFASTLKSGADQMLEWVEEYLQTLR